MVTNNLVNFDSCKESSGLDGFFFPAIGGMQNIYSL